MTEVTQDQYGSDTHPAFGMIKANRVSSSHGVSLFDSEIKHQHFVTLTLSEATRRREIQRDWIHDTKQIIEIWMSEAQWAQLVSSMNSSGTPMTIHRGPDGQLVDEPPYEPRLALSRQEVREAAAKVHEEALKRLAEYEAHPTKNSLRSLRSALENTVANIDYAAKTLDEHTENTVAKARADIEAIVANASLRGANLALDQAVGGGVFEIEAGEQ